MKIRSLDIADFLGAPGPVLDVRSPGEYAHGHIPGAVSFPLLTDGERAEVGTRYKKSGRNEAVELGFDIIGPKLGDLVRRAGELAPEGAVRVHCWRGGMRSRSTAWFLQTAGFRAVTLEGGYKSYRRHVRRIVAVPRSIRIVSGLTGTGKTSILNALEEAGEQVLDLEGLANHRGSSFGGLKMPPQPSTQHFENLIAERLSGFDPGRRLWIEAESARVGSCWVPEELFAQMKTAPTVDLYRPLEERLDVLTETYGPADMEALVEATERIRKRLGGKRTRDAVELIRQKDLRGACRIILDYYDRTYRADLERRPVEVPRLDIGGLSPEGAAARLIEKAPQLFPSGLQKESPASEKELQRTA